MIRFRYFIFLTFVFFAFSSFSFRKGALYNMGFSGYSNYGGNTSDSIKKTFCKGAIESAAEEGSIDDPVIYLDCKIILGHADEGISKMEALGDSGSVPAMNSLGTIYMSRGYNYPGGSGRSISNYDTWELYRFLYWESRNFQNMLENMQNEDPKWEALRNKERESYNLYLFPHRMYHVLKKIYIDVLSNPSTIFSNYNLEHLEDSVSFLEGLCPKAEASVVWTKAEIKILIDLCSQLNRKIFSPFLEIEKRRLQAAQACRDQGLIHASGTAADSKYYYNNCSAYKQVITDLNKGPARAMSKDPDLTSLIQVIENLKK